MFKNKKYLFFFICIFIFNFLFINKAFAAAAISSLSLNGNAGNITFNPNNADIVSIEVKSSVPVKFTRLYICSVNQTCNGTSGNYTRYFTQSDISDTITKTWNGKKSGDTEIVPEGEYKVMVSMTEGTNDPVLEFGQYSIFVSFSNNNSTGTNSNINNLTNTTSTITNTVQENQTKTRVVYLSTHSGPEELSDYTTKTPFEITAGRARMALVGSSIDFNAKYALFLKEVCSPVFKWSFGDGFESVGKDSAHIYKYPGEYQIVLNGACGEYKTISRTTVSIAVANISISLLEDGEVEILNKNNKEINIGGWKIKGGQKDFIFPTDTIISSGNRIILSKEDVTTDTSKDRISLFNQFDREVVYVIKNSNQTEIQSTTTVSIKSLLPEDYISVEKAEALLIAYRKSLNTSNNFTKKSENKDKNMVKTDNTATVLDAINTQSEKGFWSNIMKIPVKGIKSFIGMFYNL